MKEIRKNITIIDTVTGTESLVSSELIASIECAAPPVEPPPVEPPPVEPPPVEPPPVEPPTDPVPDIGLGFTVKNGRIYNAAGEHVPVRGCCHYGFNVDIKRPMNLWNMYWKDQIDKIKAMGFNAIRFALSPDMIHEPRTLAELDAAGVSWMEGSNNDIRDLTPLQALDAWMEYADAQGMYVMLDFHSVTNSFIYKKWFIDKPAAFELTYKTKADPSNPQGYSEDELIADWITLAKRYAHLSHFMAIEVINEVHDVRWDKDSDANYKGNAFYKPSMERIANAILAENPNILIMLQGITGNWDGIEQGGIPINWGENLQPQAYKPLNIPKDKLVFSPHTYGPSVFVKNTHTAPLDAALLKSHWETLFGYLFPDFAVIPSEWGGTADNEPVPGRQGNAHPLDAEWQTIWTDYMLEKGMHDSFYWTFINSGDSGGLYETGNPAAGPYQHRLAYPVKTWG